MSDADGKLIRLLLSESDKVIRKLEVEIVVKIQEDRKNNIEIRGKTFEIQRKVITEAKQEMAKSEIKKSNGVRKSTTCRM